MAFPRQTYVSFILLWTVIGIESFTNVAFSSTTIQCHRSGVFPISSQQRHQQQHCAGSSFLAVTRRDKWQRTRTQPPASSTTVSMTSITADMLGDGEFQDGEENSFLDDTTSASATTEESTSSVVSGSINLIKACVGTGVLSMPWGLAAATDAPVSVIPASISLFALGILSAYSFHLLGRICHENGATTLGEAWEKEIGKKSSWIIALSCFTVAFGSATTYSILLGDAFSSFAIAAGLKGFWATRQASILATTACTLLPLCSLSSLAALAPVSIFGVLGVLVTCGFMALRALPSGGYAMPSGFFISTLAPDMVPSFGRKMITSGFSPASLILGSMAALSYLAHINAPSFYKSMGNTKPLRKFGFMSAIGFLGVAFINAWILTCGFLTFGGNSSGIILNNYSNLDIGAVLCRFLFALSVIGTYPFMLFSMKNSFFQIFNRGKKISKSLDVKVSRCILAVITALSMVIKEAGFVNGFSGAVMGSAIIYIFPPLLHRQQIKRKIRNGTMIMTKGLQIERILGWALMAFGVCASVVGGTITVLNSFFPQLL